MMNILALPGISQKTEKWATNLLAELASAERTMTVQRYLHWDCGDGEQCLRLADEVERLRGVPIDLLVAKSLGTMIGLTAIAEKIIAPQRAVLIGTPVSGFKENNMNLREMAGLDIPCLYIQQVHDVVGPAAALKKEIDGLPGIELVEIPGDNHQYKDLKLLARHIKRWL
jgi:predicted alpha/beta-hydrolase family hydrolase